MQRVQEEDLDGSDSDVRIALMPVRQSHQEIFNKYDQNQDGKISYSEFRRVFTSNTFTYDIAEEIVTLLLTRAEKCPNGILSYEEFDCMIYWLDIFKNYDVNGDGRISLSELQSALKSESYTNDIPRQTVEEIMQRADQDDNGFLSLDEFFTLNYWVSVFHKYDTNGDGEISFTELRRALKSDSFTYDIPKRTVIQIMDKADADQNGFLNFHEFVNMINNPENKSFFAPLLGQLGELGKGYINFAVVRRRKVRGDGDQVEVPGEYENAYSCWPPAVGMIILSVLEIATYLYDSISAGNTVATGPVAQTLIYDPYRRYEVWRYLTYMFVHVGSQHLIVNLLVQIMLGIPLEMVHQMWRVGLVYLAGVVAGSLGTSITDPSVYLAGASGGVYALITAHVATIIMNWSEMRFAILQLLFFVALTGLDVGTAIYNRYVLDHDTKVGYSAHLCGAVAGLLVGINVLRNLDVRPWEKKLWWASLATYVLLMLVAVVWNAAFPSYFPVPR